MLKQSLTCWFCPCVCVCLSSFHSLVTWLWLTKGKVPFDIFVSYKYVDRRLGRHLTVSCEFLSQPACCTSQQGGLLSAESPSGTAARFCSCGHHLPLYRRAFSQLCSAEFVQDRFWFPLHQCCSQGRVGEFYLSVYASPLPQICCQRSSWIVDTLWGSHPCHCHLSCSAAPAAQCFNSGLNSNIVWNVYLDWFTYKKEWQMLLTTLKVYLFFTPQRTCHVEFLRQGLECAPISEKPHCTYCKQHFTSHRIARMLYLCSMLCEVFSQCHGTCQYYSSAS